MENEGREAGAERPERVDSGRSGDDVYSGLRSNQRTTRGNKQSKRLVINKKTGEVFYKTTDNIPHKVEKAGTLIGKDGKKQTIYKTSENAVAQEVIKNIIEEKKNQGNTDSAFVYVHESYEGDQVFFTDDGLSTITVTQNGDVVTLLNGAGGGRAVPLLLLAIDNGGIKGDFYGSEFLQKTYESVGFQMVTQTDFDDNYAPDEWDYDRFGRPPVVTMLHNGDSLETIQKSKYTNVYTLALPNMKKEKTKPIAKKIPMPEYLKKVPNLTLDQLMMKLKKSYHLTDEEEQEIRDELD